jgi:hypothetical protein
MPPKLSIGLSRKVGQPNFGSRQASIGLEVELDSALLIEPQSLQERVELLYRFADRAVETELAHPRKPSLDSPATPAAVSISTRAESHPLHQPETPENASPTTSLHPEPAASPEPATPKTASLDPAFPHEPRPTYPAITFNQRRAIHAITRRLGLNPLLLIRDRYQLEQLEDLDIRQASRLIADLKQAVETPS